MGKESVGAQTERRKNTPHFQQFSQFIEEEADITCIPLTSVQGIKSLDTKDATNKHGSTFKTRPPWASSFASGLTEAAYKGDHAPEKSTPIPRECILCGKGHHLDFCRTFQSMPMEDRKELVRKKRLCFGCLNQGHISKRCGKRLACRVCSRNPISLHVGLL